MKLDLLNMMEYSFWSNFLFKGWWRQPGLVWYVKSTEQYEHLWTLL